MLIKILDLYLLPEHSVKSEDAVIIYDLKPAIMDRLDCNQYGFIPGSNTTLALITLIHRWSKIVDKEGGCVRSLVTDYRKAFDLIDHNTLYEKLQGIGLKTSTLNWISDFLRGRLQRVKLSPNCFSNWKPVHAGVPQGTKLGPWLFLLMINDLVVSNDQFDGDMMKYADDTNVSEYITDQAENSSLQEVTNSIVDWSERNKFQLNPSKCKEFVVSFKRNEPNFSPISINESQIERADKLSILGLTITKDLKWNDHVEKIVNKASQRIYLLKQLRRFGLGAGDLKCFYVASIRSILEYSCQVFHYGLPQYLSDVIERIQKRALRIIYPQLSYQDALDMLEHAGVIYARNLLINSILDDEDHKLRNLLPPKVTSDTYNFRNEKLFNIPKYRTNRFRDTFIISSLINW